ncbi:hypothetical protein [Bacillus velezensis]|uniref:hypothetical protein n=1 Tax=Bacillus velezensis TaxID=492670 RepID=UPI001A917E33|nr:hypothetical protein [Bacillus velezensis]
MEMEDFLKAFVITLGVCILLGLLACIMIFVPYGLFIVLGLLVFTTVFLAVLTSVQGGF